MTSRLEGLASELPSEEPPGYLGVAARVAQLSDELKLAIEDCDTYGQAVLRLERATWELHLRDAWGPWSSQGVGWDRRMWDDIRLAEELADRLARRVGDSGLPARLFSMRVVAS